MRHGLPQSNHLLTSDSYSAGTMRTYILAPGNTTDRAETRRSTRC